MYAIKYEINTFWKIFHEKFSMIQFKCMRSSFWKYNILQHNNIRKRFLFSFSNLQ